MGACGLGRSKAAAEVARTKFTRPGVTNNFHHSQGEQYICHQLTVDKLQTAASVNPHPGLTKEARLVGPATLKSTGAVKHRGKTKYTASKQRSPPRACQ